MRFTTPSLWSRRAGCYFTRRIFGLDAGLSVTVLRLMAGRVEPHWEIVGAGIGTHIPCAVAGVIAVRRLHTMR